MRFHGQGHNIRRRRRRRWLTLLSGRWLVLGELNPGPNAQDLGRRHRQLSHPPRALRLAGKDDRTRYLRRQPWRDLEAPFIGRWRELIRHNPRILRGWLEREEGDQIWQLGLELLVHVYEGSYDQHVHVVTRLYGVGHAGLLVNREGHRHAAFRDKQGCLAGRPHLGQHAAQDGLSLHNVDPSHPPDGFG